MTDEMSTQRNTRQRRKTSRSTKLLGEIVKFARSEAGRSPPRFLSALRSAFPRLSIHLFEAKGRRLTSVEKSTPINKLVTENDINACLIDRKAIESRSGAKTNLLVPVLVNGSASMLVLAVRSSRSTIDVEEFAALVNAYANILSLFQVSERDALTELFNRRMLDRTLPDRMLGLSSPRRRSSDPATAHLALMDLDRFKKINDTFGHLHGDEVLLQFSGLMKQNFRASDLLVRYGGEEFVVIINDATMANCEMVFDRFREKVAEHWFPDVGHVTVSIGAVRIERQSSPAEVLDQADKSLYYAKRSGRNRVCIYEKLGNEGQIKGYTPESDDSSAYNEKRKLPTRRKPLRQRAKGRAGSAP
ncbi:MAG TPA: GGDEF domain-containing protein [Burkholderiales bacterium]|nr:GGDEF domain-containing protein [Burkholderiales bacterium]